MDYHRLRKIITCVVLLCGMMAGTAEAQWMQTAGPYGGQIRALAVSGTGLFAGTNGGVFFSSDDGMNWSARGLANMTVSALAVDGAKLYAGGDGVFQSTDNGTSWSDIGSGLGTQTVRALCVSGTYLFAGTAAGVYRASTAGGGWTPVSSIALSSKLVLSLTVSGSFVVAGTLNGGIFRTNDDGASWNNTNTGLTHLTVRALYRSENTNHLYAGGEGGVHVSTNNGRTWTDMNSGLLSGSNIPIIQALAGSGPRVYAGASNGGVFFSSDRAVTWQTTALQGNIQSLAFTPSSTAAGDDRNIFAGTSNGGVQWVLRSAGWRNRSWTARSTGITATNVIALASNATSVFAGMAIPPDLARTTNNGMEWTSSGLGRTTNALLASGNIVYAGTLGTGLQRSTDNGMSWSRLGTFGPDVRAIAREGGYLYAGVYNLFVPQNNGVYRSADNGASWSAANSGLTHKKVRALSASGSDVFAGTTDGGVYRSTDNGASWSAANSGLGNLNVMALAICGADLFAGTYGGGVFKSSDAGTSWSAANSGITDMNILSFAVYGPWVFAGSGNGLFLSVDGGASWTNAGSGLNGAQSIGALGIQGTTLYAGTLGSGVWKQALPGGTVSGTVYAGGAGLAGLAVTLLDGAGYPIPGVPPTNTGSNGTYSFSGLPPATYQVAVFEALGYLPDQNPKPVTVLPGGSHTVDFALTQTVTSNNASGRGYWKHQFDVHVSGQGQAQESATDLQAWISEIHARYTPSYPVFAGVQSFQDWQAALTVTGPQTMLVKAKAQLAAMLLNLVSLKVGQYAIATVDDRTVGDVLTYVSALIADGNPANDGLAKDLAESVNTQQMIAGGVVPPGGMLYRDADGQGTRSSAVVGEWTLEQNYPNPFNPVTTIRYAIPENGHVTLRVFDALGRMVAELEQGPKPAGSHVVTFDAHSLGSGRYYYRLEANGQVQTRKMTVLK